MQTFLPLPCYQVSAACLDRQRLGKQRVEVLQLLRALNGESQGWRNHPATRMWDGYLESLVEYGVAVCVEWIRRGYRDTCRAKIVAHSWGDHPTPPWWLGDEKFHAAHRSNLLRKDPNNYGRFGWSEPTTLPYVWPRATLFV